MTTNPIIAKCNLAYNRNWFKPKLSILGLLLATTCIAVIIDRVLPRYFTALAEREFLRAQVEGNDSTIFAFDSCGNIVYGLDSDSTITCVQCSVTSTDSVAILNTLSRSQALFKVRILLDAEYEVASKLDVFEGVTELSIKAWGGISPTDLTALATAFPNVVRLELCSEFRKPNRLRLLTAFEHLKILELECNPDDVSAILATCSKLDLDRVKIYDTVYDM